MSHPHHEQGHGAGQQPAQGQYAPHGGMPYDQERDAAASREAAPIVRGPHQPGRSSAAWSGPSARGRGGAPAQQDAPHGGASQQSAWGQAPAGPGGSAAPGWGGAPQQDSGPQQGWGQPHHAPQQEQPGAEGPVARQDGPAPGADAPPAPPAWGGSPEPAQAAPQSSEQGSDWGAPAAAGAVGAGAVGAAAYAANRGDEQDASATPGGQQDSTSSTDGRAMANEPQSVEPPSVEPQPDSPHRDDSAPQGTPPPQGDFAPPQSADVRHGQESQDAQPPAAPGWNAPPPPPSSADAPATREPAPASSPDAPSDQQAQAPGASQESAPAWGEPPAPPQQEAPQAPPAPNHAPQHGGGERSDGPGWGTAAAAAGAAGAAGAGAAHAHQQQEPQHPSDSAPSAPAAPQHTEQPPASPGWGQEQQSPPSWDQPGQSPASPPGAPDAGDAPAAPGDEAEELPTQVTPMVEEPPTGDEPADEALTIGRGRANSIVLDDMLVSRQHVRITVDDEGLVLEDLGSRNGTFVNGRRIERTHLHEGDRIGVGASTFEVRDGWLVSV